MDEERKDFVQNIKGGGLDARLAHFYNQFEECNLTERVYDKRLTYENPPDLDDINHIWEYHVRGSERHISLHFRSSVRHDRVFRFELWYSNEPGKFTFKVEQLGEEDWNPVSALKTLMHPEGVEATVFKTRSELSSKDLVRQAFKVSSNFSYKCYSKLENCAGWCIAFIKEINPDAPLEIEDFWTQAHLAMRVRAQQLEKEALQGQIDMLSHLLEHAEQVAVQANDKSFYYVAGGALVTLFLIGILFKIKKS